MARPGAPQPIAASPAQLWPVYTYLLLLAGISVLVALAVSRGEAGWLYGVVPMVAGAVLLYPASLQRPRRGVGAPVRRQSRTPGFHAFLLRRLGSPLRPGRVLFRLFLQPLAAPSLGEFWRQWNAPYAYVLRFFVYGPLRRRWPRPVAIYLTFLASGFLLHDLPFNFRDGIGVPRVTLLFAIFGACVLVSDALRIRLAPRPWWLRTLANLGWLSMAFALRWLVLESLHLG